MGMKEAVVHARVSEAEAALIRQRAEEADRSVSAEVRRMIRRALQNDEGRPAKTALVTTTDEPGGARHADKV